MRADPFLLVRVACIVSLALAASCSANSDPTGPAGNAGPPGGTGGNGTQFIETGGTVEINVDVLGEPPPGCANGVLTEDEACDDGNEEDGDGCAGNCLALEAGWSCATPGEACIRIARCGDGFLAFPELCDDGNVVPGDGCSATCKVEVGHKCDGGSPSSCTTTACNDGVQEGAESCEDDNTMPFDGCSVDCQAEPDCSGGACVSECGDGLVLGEECDDGNNIDGDGCSADCKEEPGYVCHVPQPNGYMKVPAVFRDFRESHPDFEPNANGLNKPLWGMVQDRLGPDGKPVYVAVEGSFVTSEATFNEWYRDVPDNSTTVSSLTLWDSGGGTFVNRVGENGEQFLDLSGESDHWCGAVGDEVDGEPCTSVYGAPECDRRRDELYRCEQRNDAWWGIFVEATHDGDPAFFPVDDDQFTPRAERDTALISTYYGGNWAEEEGAPLHNFHFTSEVRYWFQYTTGQNYVLDFTGDDDVWVFINGRLAVDVGGIHTAVNGHLVINATGQATVTFAVTDGDATLPSQRVDLGLQSGNVYEIAVFHAERQKQASTFKLTLEGFATARSECGPICGDSIVSLGEECDDGINDGGYGECGPDCMLGDFCGDGILQAGEECDDGNNLDHDGCGSGCRNIVIR